MLIKVSATASNRAEAIELAQVFRARVVDVSEETSPLLTEEERDVLFDQARNPTKYAVKAPADGGTDAAASESIQAQDAGLNDTLPTTAEGAYFDADEPEEENLPPQPANN